MIPRRHGSMMVMLCQEERSTVWIVYYWHSIIAVVVGLSWHVGDLKFTHVGGYLRCQYTTWLIRHFDVQDTSRNRTRWYPYQNELLAIVAAVISVDAGRYWICCDGMLHRICVVVVVVIVVVACRRRRCLC